MKESRLLRLWNPRVIRIFEDRLEFGALNEEGVFVQKSGGKSPVPLDLLRGFHVMINGAGGGSPAGAGPGSENAAFYLEVADPGAGGAVRTEAFRCGSLRERGRVLAALAEAKQGAAEAAAGLASAMDCKDAGALEAAIARAERRGLAEGRPLPHLRALPQAAGAEGRVGGAGSGYAVAAGGGVLRLADARAVLAMLVEEQRRASAALVDAMEDPLTDLVGLQVGCRK